jgi:amino acid transporter
MAAEFREGISLERGLIMSQGLTEGSKLPSGEHVRLHRGVLGLLDIAAATMANIGPAMSFYFGFGFLAYTAGVASPLTIVVAGVAIALLGNTLSEFTKVLPSTGGFITYIGKSFGPRTAVTTSLMTGLGYMAAMSSVVAVVGGFFQQLLQNYNVAGLKNVPWIVWTLIFLAFAVFMMVRGISISTKIAGFFFAFEMIVMVTVSIIALIKFHAHISMAPFEPKNIHNGLKGLALGFPLAIYLFIGWENSAALAEETENPRRNVPRAVFTSIAIMSASYLLFAFSTVVAYKNNVGALSSAAVPFIGMSQKLVGVLAFLAFIAGMTSTIGSLIAGTNSQARLVFNAGREGLLPAVFGKVNQKRRTPVNALVIFLGVSMFILGFWGLGHLLGHNTSGSMSALNYFFEVSTFGTILVLVVYAMANLALPIFMQAHRPDEVSFMRHVILPLTGIFVIGVPMYSMIAPGQAQPYNWFPKVAVAYIVLSMIYAAILVKRDPSVGDRVGSLVADE